VSVPRRLSAVIGSVAFFLVAPVVVAGVIPWWLTKWEMKPVAMPIRMVGIVVVAGGALALVYSFARFVVEGIGTPAPVAPTEHLVVGGLYRYVRNPMYVAVIATILGQAMLFGQLVLVVYAAIAGTVMASFARWYEEPALARRFGESYEDYRRHVPGWWPRFRPWHREIRG
jgi:protein-S-isoprenylcysteine O-methyltransferase Ste14